jgi:hypothetical protein
MVVLVPTVGSVKARLTCESVATMIEIWRGAIMLTVTDGVVDFFKRTGQSNTT